MSARCLRSVTGEMQSTLLREQQSYVQDEGTSHFAELGALVLWLT